MVQDPFWYIYWPRHIWQSTQQQSGCGCGSALQVPRHLLKSIVGSDNVVVNRQHFYSYLEGGSNDWSTSGIVYLLHISASPSTHRNQPNVCTTSAHEILRDTCACLSSLCPLELFWGRTQVSDNLLSIHLHYVNIDREQQNICSSLDNWFGVRNTIIVELRIGP